MKQRSLSLKTKKKTASTKSEAKAAKAKPLMLKEVTVRWNEEVRRTKWHYDEWYKHPPGTQTIARTEAEELPRRLEVGTKLKKDELDTLRYEERFANNGGLMKLHDRVEVLKLIRKRRLWLDRKVSTSHLHSESSAQAGPSSSTQPAPPDSLPPE
ncbi:hypothetical protein PENSPDRAFT_664563 [Peniophora sp. CONT]|nr:hypothetical protein PENSPDRAFT_664563 [Peniophora sp. CONT]